MTEDVNRALAAMSVAERAAMERRLLEQRGRGRGTAGDVIPRRGSAGPAPLSFAQQRLWFLDQFEPGSPLYTMARRIRLSGELNADTLGRALTAVVSRHEVLRTRFVAANGTPMQVVEPAAPVPLPTIDLSGFPAAEREAEVSRHARAEADRPFDLAAGPVFPATLLRLTPQEHILLLTAHHIASDVWSQGVLLRELGALYRAMVRDEPSPLAELPIQYADYAVWQRGWMQGETERRQLTYWLGKLAGAPASLDLPTDRPRPAIRSVRGARLSRRLSSELSERLTALSRRHGVTLFTTLLAAFQALLARYCGQDDIVVGSPIAGRSRTETEPLIGCFVNTLALRTDLSDDPTFAQLLARVREVTLEAYAHQDLPFERLVEELHPDRELSRTPVFQVMFALQNAPGGRLELEGLSLRSEASGGRTARFDLALFMWERQGGLTTAVEYSTDLFDATTIERILEHFGNLLEAVANNPEQRLSRVPILGEAERKRLLVELNRTAVEYPREATIHQLVAAQAAATPHAPAVVSKGRRLTYAELDHESTRVAGALRARGVGPESRVGVALPRGADLVVAVLGVLKAGGAYVPLDVRHPPGRLATILAEARVGVIVTDATGLDRLPAHAAPTVLRIDGQRDGEAGREAQVVDAARPESLAYVIYTSGSTGKPKGVAIEHRNVTALIGWALHTYSRDELVGVLAATSLSFDISVFELFAPLCSGGAVVIAESALDLAEAGETATITLINTVPTAAAELVRSGAIPNSVVAFNSAGETLGGALAQGIYRETAVRRLFNLYGPTETTVYSTYTVVDRNGGGEPDIGRAIGNTQVYVLDRQMQPVPVGVPGELYIGGAGVARGYLGRPELTAAAFVPNPFAAAESATGERLYRTGDRGRWRPDGVLEFLGRRDKQVKLRGYRIELGEIEVVLASHPAVRAVAVILSEDASGEPRLVAYLVPSAKAPDVQEVRHFLERQLPDYMVPSAFVILDALPLTPNGKVDHRALPAPIDPQVGPARAVAAPVTATQRSLVDIWRTVLRLDRIGIDEDFFALGGHSLLATQVLSRVRDAFGVAIPVRALFEARTVASLAERVERNRSEGNGVATSTIPRIAREEYRVGTHFGGTSDG